MLCMSVSVLHAQDIDVMFWNLENFFDYVDESRGESDTEFSPGGAKHWTKTRFLRKCDAISKTILWLGDQNKKLPDIIGFCEVENAFVLSLYYS